MGELVSRLVTFVSGPPRGHVGWRFRNLAAAEAARKAALLSALVVSSLRPIFGPPGAYFGLSWGPFWASYRPWGPWAAPGPLPASLGPSLARSWGPLGPILAALGPLLGRSWLDLRPLLAPLGPVLGPAGPLLGPLGPLLAAKTLF